MEISWQGHRMLVVAPKDLGISSPLAGIDELKFFYNRALKTGLSLITEELSAALFSSREKIKGVNYMKGKIDLVLATEPSKCYQGCCRQLTALLPRDTGRVYYIDNAAHRVILEQEDWADNDLRPQNIPPDMRFVFLIEAGSERSSIKVHIKPKSVTSTLPPSSPSRWVQYNLLKDSAAPSGTFHLAITRFLNWGEEHGSLKELGEDFGALGQRHACELLLRQELIPESWRKFNLYFPGTIWETTSTDRGHGGKTVTRLVPFLRYDTRVVGGSKSWNLYYHLPDCAGLKDERSRVITLGKAS